MKRQKIKGIIESVCQIEGAGPKRRNYINARVWRIEMSDIEDGAACAKIPGMASTKLSSMEVVKSSVVLQTVAVLDKHTRFTDGLFRIILGLRRNFT